MKPVIKVDHREQHSGLPELLKQQELTVQFRMLDAGDYIIGERFIIERKTAADFLRSIFDGRLFEQCRKLQANHFFPLLLLEGNPFISINPSNYTRIKAAMIAICAGWQIPIVYSRDVNDSCGIILQLIEQQIKRKRFVMAHRGKRRPSDHLAVQFLEGIPGLGPYRSSTLLKSAGSIRGY
ncbi:MAG: hypothetical protein NVV59_19380 [Chitinophagaceae bacterium]|nr:hypothetical protein [Chitinophagaceae bacterium]